MSFSQPTFQTIEKFINDLLDRLNESQKDQMKKAYFSIKELLMKDITIKKGEFDQVQKLKEINETFDKIKKYVQQLIYICLFPNPKKVYHSFLKQLNGFKEKLINQIASLQQQQQETPTKINDSEIILNYLDKVYKRNMMDYYTNVLKEYRHVRMQNLLLKTQEYEFKEIEKQVREELELLQELKMISDRILNDDSQIVQLDKTLNCKITDLYFLIDYLNEKISSTAQNDNK